MMQPLTACNVIDDVLIHPIELKWQTAICYLRDTSPLRIDTQSAINVNVYFLVLPP